MTERILIRCVVVAQVMAVLKILEHLELFRAELADEFKSELRDWRFVKSFEWRQWFASSKVRFFEIQCIL